MAGRKIAPSILSADYTRLGEEIKSLEAAGADLIHVDVMDGHFVPNITIGPMIVEAVRTVTPLPLDVHLMIKYPERFIDAFVRAGADLISVHQEACPHLHRVCQYIREQGCRPAVAINPSTPVSTLSEILPDVDMVLVMTVNPGFGGQRFIENMLPKVRRLSRMADEKGLDLEIEVDGGITAANIAPVAEAGATVFVSGTGIFGTEDYEETIRAMKGIVK